MPTIAEQREYGKALRRFSGRAGHARLTLPERDPIAILEEQNSARMADLVPIRIGRMLESPFAFYRGTAAVMAHDLTAAPVTGQQVLCCGDAHIANFGLYASPERRLLFDLNDFDEASNAPWEWDVKRLAASIVVGGRDNGLSDEDSRDIAQGAVRQYRLTLRWLLEHTVLERYYFQIETDFLEELAAKSRNTGLVRRATRKARRRTSEQVLEKMATSTEDGDLRIVDVPPITRHLDDVGVDQLATLFEQYRYTLRADTAFLLAQFRLADFVLRVVGVGSVGTRCFVVMLVGPAGAPLFLQVKEAAPSVLETYGGYPCRLDYLPPVDYGHQGYRVVSGQRILQAQSDPFLGWISSPAGLRGGAPQFDFYWRQFRDMKGSVETRGLTRSEYEAYVTLCGSLLARAHSQSPRAGVVAGYLGGGDSFERAVAAWALAYADLAERDFAALEKAVRNGRLPADRGV